MYGATCIEIAIYLGDEAGVFGFLFFLDLGGDFFS